MNYICQGVWVGKFIIINGQFTTQTTLIYPELSIFPTKILTFAIYMTGYPLLNETQCEIQQL